MFATIYSDHAQKCNDEYMNMRKYELYKQQMETQKLKQQYMANPHLASASTNFYHQTNTLGHPQNSAAKILANASSVNSCQSSSLSRHKSSNMISPTSTPVHSSMTNNHQQRTSLSNLTNNSNQTNNTNNNTSTSNLNSPISQNSSIISQYHQNQQHYPQQQQQQQITHIVQNDASYQQNSYSNGYFDEQNEYRYQQIYNNNSYPTQTLNTSNNNNYYNNFNGSSYNAGQVASDASQIQPQNELYHNLDKTPHQSSSDVFDESSTGKNEAFNSNSTNTNDAAMGYYDSASTGTTKVNAQQPDVDIIETNNEMSNLDELLLDHELILESIFAFNVNPIKLSSIEQIENELRSYCSQNKFF